MTNVDESLLILGCPLCSIFLNPRENVRTKLYWPENIEDIYGAEFVILDCNSCKVPMVVMRNHVTEITREAWGRVLYRCRILFGKGVRLRTYRRTCRDHAHFHKTNEKY